MMILAQTFYYDETAATATCDNSTPDKSNNNNNKDKENKRFLQEILRSHIVWQDIRFWEEVPFAT